MRKIFTGIALTVLFFMPNITLAQRSGINSLGESEFPEELEEKVREFQSRAISETQSILRNQKK